MIRAADSSAFKAVNHQLNFPEAIEKFMFPRAHETGNENKGVSSIPVDILDAPKEYIFFLDVPGISKSDIQVTVEDDNTLVIRSNGQRKHNDGEEEGCKYTRLEGKAVQKLLRKFRYVAAITAKCENGGSDSGCREADEGQLDSCALCTFRLLVPGFRVYVFRQWNSNLSKRATICPDLHLYLSLL